MTGGGETLLTTALTDPARRAVQAAWHTAGATPVTRAPLPDDRLATSLLPLRVAGKTAGQRLVLAAAEQVVVALRSVFACDPRPEVMRAAGRGAAPGPEATETAKAAKSARTAKAAKAAGAATRGRSTVRPGEAGGWRRDEEADEGRLRSSCENLPAVLERTSRECTRRHALLVAAVREACAGPVDGLHAVPREVKPAEEAVAAGVGPGVGAERAEPGATAGAWGDGGAGQGCVATRTVRGAVGVSPTSAGMQAVVDRGALGMMPVEQLGDGELRFLALALVLLTGPGVLEMDPAGEIPVGLPAADGHGGRPRPLPGPPAGARTALAGGTDGRTRSCPAAGVGTGSVGRRGAARCAGATSRGMSDDLHALQRRLAEFAAARDWQQYHTPKNLAAALSVEAAELVEIFQWLTPEQSSTVMSDPEAAGRVEDEVADVLAYLLQFCEALGIDALTALAAKIERNEARFPPVRRALPDRPRGSEGRGGEGE